MPSGSARMKERPGACSDTTRGKGEANRSMAMNPTILARLWAWCTRWCAGRKIMVGSTRSDDEPGAHIVRTIGIPSPRCPRRDGHQDPP